MNLFDSSGFEFLNYSDAAGAQNSLRTSSSSYKLKAGDFSRTRPLQAERGVSFMNLIDSSGFRLPIMCSKNTKEEAE